MASNVFSLPLAHDNTGHTVAYIHTTRLGGSFYNAADQSVIADTETVLASVIVSTAAGAAGFVFPNPAFLNYRAGTIAAPAILDLWWDVNTLQRSAKIPISVSSLELVKRPATIPLIYRNLNDMIFWNSPVAASITVSLKARRQVSSDPGTATVVVSDVGFPVSVFQRDLP